MNKCTRRTFGKIAGIGIVSGFTDVSAVARGQSDSGWKTAESPTTKTLYGVSDSVTGPYAVGGGGDVITRKENGWKKVVEYGPQARSRRLTACDVTDDGKAIWFVGGSGVIGEYNVETRTLTNYSAPKGKTSTWEDCAIVGNAGENERLYFVNGSGELLVGVRQNSGAVKYEDVIKPGGGSTTPGVDFHARNKGHVCSTSQFVAETTDRGNSWTRIGIDFAGQNFFDVASVGAKDVNIAGGGGIVYRYDGFRWTPHVIDDGRQAIRSIDRDGDAGLAAGSGGKVFERKSAGQWRRYQTPASTKLRGVARGRSYDVAVGGGGTIVERQVDRSGSSGGTGTTTTETPTKATNNTTATDVTDSSNTTEATETTNVPNASALQVLDEAGLEIVVDPKEVYNYVEGKWIFG